MARESATSVLDLSESCLQAVLHHTYHGLWGGKRSLFSAARAHSRLHQAAVLVVSHITAEVEQQQQVDSVLQYLANHGQHVLSLNLEGPWNYCYSDSRVTMQQLPHDSLQELSSLRFKHHLLQLQPGGGFQGILRAGAPLKELQLCECKLLDGDEGLAAALPMLPELQILSCVTHCVGHL
jgi:hypothetical protein